MKAPEFDKKLLKKVEGYISQNFVYKTIKMKTIVWILKIICIIFLFRQMSQILLLNTISFINKTHEFISSSPSMGE